MAILPLMARLAPAEGQVLYIFWEKIMDWDEYRAREEAHIQKLEAQHQRFMVKHAKPGYVYMIEAVGCGRFKIGLSTKPQKQQRELSSQSPYPLVMACSHSVSNMAEAKMYWHGVFESRRVYGEWFDLRREDVEQFTSWQGVAS